MIEFQAGDIAACYGADPTSLAISIGTASMWQRPRWGPSHVAIVTAIRPTEHLPLGSLDGTFRPATQPSRGVMWCESTTMSRTDCLIAARPVAGVQFHCPITRINEYCDAGGRVDLYRLGAIHRFTPDEQQLLTSILVSLRGTQYDYFGAMVSGTRVFQRSSWFPGADLNELFCSELVAAILMRMNRINHANPTRFSPARLLRELLRTGKYVPAERFRPRRGHRLRLFSGGED